MDDTRSTGDDPTGRDRPSRPTVDVSGLTDQGRVRPSNQDQYLVARLDRQLDVVQTSLEEAYDSELCQPSVGWALMVADGVGGQPGGGEASSVAVSTSMHYLNSAVPWFLDCDPERAAEAEDVLRRVVGVAHRKVQSEAARGPAERQQMGTTLTLAFVLRPRLFVVHVGDSRCYLLRAGQLRRLTRDHTLVRELADEGGEEAGEDPGARGDSLLTNVVGGGDPRPPLPDVLSLEVQDGDTLLLCTDGLTGAVTDAAIAAVLQEHGFANERCAALLEAARTAGASDNVTVVSATFGSLPG